MVTDDPILSSGKIGMKDTRWVKSSTANTLDTLSRIGPSVTPEWIEADNHFSDLELEALNSGAFR